MKQDDPHRKPDEAAIINSTVSILIKHGAKKSPYAMTEKARKNYVDLQRNNPEQFVAKVHHRIAEIQEYMNNIQDESEWAECLVAIDKFKTDIKLC